MSATELSKLLSQLPDEATVPVSWVRAQLDAPVLEDAIGDYSCAQAATTLGVKPGTVRGFCFRGEMPGSYLFHGKSWRIPRASLRAYLDNASKEKSHVSGENSADLGSWRKQRRGH